MRLESLIGLSGSASALVVLFFLPVALAAECSDTVQLAGANSGCHSYVGELKKVDLGHCGFTKTPAIEVSAQTSDPNDKVTVTVSSKDKSRFSVLISSSGRNGSEICANSSFSWTARGK